MRRIAPEAWEDSTTIDIMSVIIRSIPDRSRAVINPNRGHGPISDTKIFSIDFDRRDLCG